LRNSWIKNGTSGGGTSGVNHIDKVDGLLADVAQRVQAIEEELEDIRLLGPDRREPVLLETSLLQARRAMDDALTLLRSHRTVE
jgi:hypothetical protein